MSASSNVVTLLAEQNIKTDNSGKCVAEQEHKTEKSVKSLDCFSGNCALDELGRRKKRLDRETQPDLKLELNKFDEDQEEVIGVSNVLNGDEIGGKTFGIKQKRGGLPSIEAGFQVMEPCPGKIGRRKGKRDRKVGLEMAPHRRVMGNMVQAKINVLGGPDKYGVAAECHLTVNCSLAVFRTLIVPHAARVLPKAFNKDTAVILAQAVNSSQITSIFGPAKVRVLRGSYSWVATKMDLVYLPSTGELRMWWVMST